MALKPNDGETFLKEVDDELRRERVGNFVTRYGWWLIAAAVLLLGALGDWIWWQGRQAAAREAEGETLIDALGKLESPNRATQTSTAQALAGLAGSGTEGYRAAALFAQANSHASAGNLPAAIATLRTIAGDQGLDQAYRDAALIRQTALEFDTLPPQEVIRRLRHLAVPGSAWIGSAGELVGVAHLKMNRPDLAGPVFAAIARDRKVPDPLRARAAHMAASLGVDVSVPAAGNPARPAAAPPQPTPTPTPAAAPAPAPAPAIREKTK